MNISANQFMVKRIKKIYRWMRVRLLSVGLQHQGEFLLTAEERCASDKISIVVAVHDGLEFTRRCLNSLEVFCGGAEVIVVDDGSTLTEVRQMLENYCESNSWKLVKHATALGHSRASEAGVSVSTRPFICLLNSDTVVTPRSWDGVVRAFELDSNVAVVGPSTSQTVGPQVVRRALHCRYYWSDEQIWGFAEKYVAINRQKPIIDLPMVGGFAFFVRRSVWDEMGSFDENLPDYGNETEFCLRVIRSGYRIVWSKTGYIHHLGSESYGKTLGMDTIHEHCLWADSYILNGTHHSQLRSLPQKLTGFDR